MKFSVLMSIYSKEKVDYFNRAMLSIWDQQTLKPDEIVLVQDGPLTSELYESVEWWSTKLPDILKVIALEKNIGLGSALNVGLKECNYELVARMDADDISLPNRFERQIDTFRQHANISICGSFIEEVREGDLSHISFRAVPETQEEILDTVVFKSPFNHMTVMYNKLAINSVGGYLDLPWMEDWYLWLRLLSCEYHAINLKDNLVIARTGKGMIVRRSGWNYIRSEWIISKYRHQLGFQSRFSSFCVFVKRSLPRLLPQKVLYLVYLYSRKYRG